MSAQPQKINLRSLDITEEKRAQLQCAMRGICPEVFSEGMVDFAQLQRVLGEWNEPGKERFGLNWHGKAACMKIIQQTSVATLKPARDESVHFDDTDNLFIEGDNLEVLKLLQKSYFGMVKMIYIDPPYNTGKEFIYPDKYNETLGTYLEYTGQKDSKGRKFSTNTDTHGRYHSNWLNMMYPRLYLARNLLREDGVIFVSIDDNEQANLKALCDQVFGEENFVGTIAWQNLDTKKNDAAGLSNNHEYLHLYARNIDEINLLGVPKTEKQRKPYRNPDNDARGAYLLTPLHAKSGKPDPKYEYKFRNGVKWKPPTGRYPSYSNETLNKLDEDNRIYFGSDGKKIPQKKTFLCEVSERMVASTFWDYKFAGSTRQSNAAISELMGKGIFPNSKPVTYIRRMLELCSDGEATDITLDFFAGSCTTAHAVLDMNREDRGSRRFIMVQLPEPIDETFEAGQENYKTIADIGKERIRRAGQEIEKEHYTQSNMGGDNKLDIGFKVFKLAKSNFKVWAGDTENIENLNQQLLDHVDHIDTTSTAEDTLYELLLKSGFPLTTKIEKRTLAGKTVFSMDEGRFLVCLEKNLTQASIDAIAETNPQQVICLDDGFKDNDQLKVNAVQTFQSRARQKEREIVFRTV